MKLMYTPNFHCLITFSRKADFENMIGNVSKLLLFEMRDKTSTFYCPVFIPVVSIYMNYLYIPDLKRHDELTYIIMRSKSVHAFVCKGCNFIFAKGCSYSR